MSSLYICMITGDNIGLLHNIEIKNVLFAKCKIKKLNVPSIGFEFAFLFLRSFLHTSSSFLSCNFYIRRIKIVMHACLSCATQIHFKAIQKKFQKKLFFYNFFFAFSTRIENLNLTKKKLPRNRNTES